VATKIGPTTDLDDRHATDSRSRELTTPREAGYPYQQEKTTLAGPTACKPDCSLGSDVDDSVNFSAQPRQRNSLLRSSVAVGQAIRTSSNAVSRHAIASVACAGSKSILLDEVVHRHGTGSDHPVCGNVLLVTDNAVKRLINVLVGSVGFVALSALSGVRGKRSNVHLCGVRGYFLAFLVS
jgi:hypothetical protein